MASVCNCISVFLESSLFLASSLLLRFAGPCSSWVPLLFLLPCFGALVLLWFLCFSDARMPTRQQVVLALLPLLPSRAAGQVCPPTLGEMRCWFRCELERLRMFERKVLGPSQQTADAASLSQRQ